MNKKSVLWTILYLIFLAVFNMIFFIAGGSAHTASVWISYGFIHFSYIMLVITPLLIRKSTSADVFGFSLYSISSTYFIVEFIIGLIFIFINSNSYKSSLIVQIIIAAIYGIVLVSHLIANETTADNIERHEYEIAYIKNGASKLKTYMGRSSNRRVNREIEKLYDLLHSSPTKSNATVRSLEIEIANKISALGDLVLSDQQESIIAMCGEITMLIEERTRQLRMYN
jgi:signal transduction histidine kinase